MWQRLLASALSRSECSYQRDSQLVFKSVEYDAVMTEVPHANAKKTHHVNIHGSELPGRPAGHPALQVGSPLSTRLCDFVTGMTGVFPREKERERRRRE